jgi:hypothetical protein
MKSLYRYLAHGPPHSSAHSQRDRGWHSTPRAHAHGVVTSLRSGIHSSLTRASVDRVAHDTRRWSRVDHKHTLEATHLAYSCDSRVQPLVRVETWTLARSSLARCVHWSSCHCAILVYAPMKCHICSWSRRTVLHSPRSIDSTREAIRSAPV